MSKGFRTGFTLIELLVVIAIISILASILMPVFSQARAKGRAAACISNVRQILMAISMYTQDNDECVVRGQMDPADIQSEWYNSIFAYTHNRQILFCPDRKDSGPGYGLNYYAGQGIAIGMFFDTASKILIADVPPERIQATMPGDGKIAGNGNWWVNEPGNSLPGHPPSDDSFSGGTPKYPQRHNEQIVFGYVDGHSKLGHEQSMAQKLYWLPAEPSS
jgi:prepilin-type N-terminal cleavage/methylation domain-containing protein